ncbi:MAG: hypothetical protein AAGN35_09250 [Bacteroidota bacterium]
MRFLLTCCLIGLFGLSLKAQNWDLGGPDFVRKVSRDKLPSALKFKGEFRNGYIWREKGEPRILVVSEVRHPEALRNDLYVAQYAWHNRRLGLMWSLKEFAKTYCEVSIYENSLQVIDLDGDGNYETCFHYKVHQEREARDETKMLLYHNGEKLGMRGKLDPEKRAVYDLKADSALRASAPVFENFLQVLWQYWEAGEVHGKWYIRARGEEWMLTQVVDAPQYDVEYIIRNADFTDRKMNNLWGPQLLSATWMEPLDEETLLFVSGNQVGTYDPGEDYKYNFLDLPHTTEMISPPVWSEDRSRVAFVVLNAEEYPQLTRIYVLDVDQHSVVGQQEIEVNVEHTLFEDWEFTLPQFVNDTTLSIVQGDWDELQAGAAREVYLRPRGNK